MQEPKKHGEKACSAREHDWQADRYGSAISKHVRTLK
jgi:hypothetical protein